MPDDRPVPRAHQLWLGQVVFRIGAAAKGIARVYPGQETEVAAFSEAISRRYKKASVEFAMDPLRHAVVRVDSRNDPDAAVKNAIMHDLDSLLARIGQRSMDSEAVLVELKRIADGVKLLLHGSAMPLSAPSPATEESNGARN